MLQDDLESEFEEVEGAKSEEQHLQPARAAPAASVPIRAARQLLHPDSQNNTVGEDELATLHERMIV